MLKQTIVALGPVGRLFMLSPAGLLIAAHGYAAEPMPPRPSAETMAHACAGCHGSYGRSQGDTPALAGMAESRFVAQMRAFKSGTRVSSIMNRIAKGYGDEDFKAMARFFHRN